MAEASSSRAEPKSLRQHTPRSNVDPRLENRRRSSGTGRNRTDFYEGQRGAAPPAPASHSTRHRQGQVARRPSYTYSDDYDNLDELAAPAPVQNPEERSRYRRDDYLEDEERDKQPAQSGKKEQKTGRDTQQGQGLSEVDAPRPVDNSDESGQHQRGDQLDEDDSSDDALPPSFSRHSEKGQQEQTESQPSRASQFATRLYTISYLIFFSILGTLARLGVQWLTFYPGAPVVISVLWANVGGSFVMGFLSEDQRLFRDGYVGSRKHDLKDHSKVKKTIPLYIGLATGFCGSFTSFSSFERDTFLALSNNLSTPIDHPVAGTTSFTSTVHRNGGYSVMALLAIIFLTVSLSLCALFVGAHLALALDRFTPSLPFKFVRKFLDRLMLFLGPACWIGAIIMSILPPDRPGGPSSRGTWANETWRGEVLFALVFAPVGCLLRFYASLKLNGIMPSFPLGTFVVNMFGCVVEAMCYDIQRLPLESIPGMMTGGGRVGCQVLQGVMDGFCGCLTTVSTFVSELQGLKRQHAYVYGVVTITVGLCIMIAIMGSVRWSIGWSDTACATTRTAVT